MRRDSRHLQICKNAVYGEQWAHSTLLVWLFGPDKADIRLLSLIIVNVIRNDWH